MKTTQAVISVLIVSLLFSCTSQQQSFAKVRSDNGALVQAAPARNPVIWADVPDVAVIRVGETYYMSSTTMHMSPGLPIMKSKDLVNWELIGYAYDRLVENDAMNMENGRSCYGRGSWASSLRYHNGTYYVSTFSSTSGRTHIYTTPFLVLR